jgi:hypothetical protein
VANGAIASFSASSSASQAAFETKMLSAFHVYWLGISLPHSPV